VFTPVTCTTLLSNLCPGIVSMGLSKVITDEVADILINHLYGTVPKLMEAWYAMPLPILKADFFRYLILLARGGIYADIDTEALRPAHQWLPETSPVNTVGLIIGIEADPTRDDWALWYSRRIQFCQWTMRAKIGHPVLLEVVTRIVETTLASKEDGSLAQAGQKGLPTLSIIEWTGPAVWTDSVFSWMNTQTMTGKGTKPGAGSAEWSWVQFTGITEPKVRYYCSLFGSAWDSDV
jgi:alpha 1,6-mannosyltransferase